MRCGKKRVCGGQLGRRKKEENDPESGIVDWKGAPAPARKPKAEAGGQHKKRRRIPKKWALIYAENMGGDYTSPNNDPRPSVIHRRE